MRNDRRGYQDLDGAAFHLVGVHASRILKCETVADLPVQQSTTVALTLNLVTAKTLGRLDRDQAFEAWADGYSAAEYAAEASFPYSGQAPERGL